MGKDCGIDSRENDSVPACTAVEPATKIAPRRTDHSANSKMRDAVKLFETIARQWDEGTLPEQWDHVLHGDKPSRAKFAKLAGISAKTFQKYTCDDASKRRKPGAKVGRPTKMNRRRLEEEKAKLDRRALRDHYREILRGTLDMAPALQLLGFGRRRRSASRLERQYRSMNLNFRRERTPAEKGREKQWFDNMLPDIRLAMGASNKFVQDELELLKRCHETFGPWEARYEGPDIDDTEKGKTTFNRRKRILRRLERFELVQTRHALSMLESRAGRRELLVAIDVLIKKYDDGLIAQGLEPSGLRPKVRETNHIFQGQLKEKKGQEGQLELNEWSVKNLDLTPEEHNDFCRQMRREINNESTALEATKQSDLRMSIWEHVRQTLAGTWTDLELMPILDTLQKICGGEKEISDALSTDMDDNAADLSNTDTEA